jgi:hypothetical protein
MRQFLGRRQFLAGTALAGISSAAGCGALFYPERRGQPVGRLDWGVVLLDGIGLLLFFVPGVVAFVVDFATGAIYLPPDPPPYGPPGDQPIELSRIKLDRDRLTPAEISRAVSAETGRDFTLQEGQYYTTRLSDLDGFWPAFDGLAAAHSEPPAELPSSANLEDEPAG